MRLVIELDAIELAVRMAEAYSGMRRPGGVTAKQAFASMDDDCREAYAQGALAAMEYFRAQTEKGVVPS